MSTFTWATVTALSPLRVKLDGDTDALPITPDSLVDPLALAVNARVRCELASNRLVVLGRAGGVVEVPPGVVSATAAAAAPSGWLICDGSAVSRTTYSALFTAIGTQFGTGDGSTTFNVPNLKGRVPVGLDSAQAEFDVLGESGGEKAHTLTIPEMPAHWHPYNYGNPAGGDGSGLAFSSTDGTQPNLAGIGSAGGGAAHNNLQPYVVVNYIIKT